MSANVVRVDPRCPASATIERAAAVIRAGGTVAFPTETVYGLGANGLDEAAVRRIFAAKGRPADNPLILHIADFADLAPLVRAVPTEARALAEAFWPGPLTLVLARSERVPAAVSAGLPTVAVRMPSHPVAAALIRAAGVPIAAPSANRSGRPSPTTAQHVLDDLGDRIDLIIDGGPTAVGVESTVLDLTCDPPALLRPGGVTLEMLAEIIGPVTIAPGATADPREGVVSRPRSPGMKYRHYAPAAPLTLVEGESDAVAAQVRRLLAAELAAGRRAAALASDELAAELRRQFAERTARPIVTALGPRDDAAQMAANLYARLRELDEAGAEVIVAEGFSDRGMGLALMNRLRRAAGGRIVRAT